MVLRRRRDGREKPAPIRSATVVRDFYSFVDINGKPNDEIESWMAKEVEGPAMTALRAVRDGVSPKRESIIVLARFMAISLLRTRTVRSYSAQVDAHTRPLFILTHALRRSGLNFSQVGEDAFLRAWRAAVEVSRSMSMDEEWDQRSVLRTMLRKVDEFSTILVDWNWSVEESLTDQLLTGDSPVATLTAEEVEGWAGLLPSGSSVALPVSPRRLLLASPNPLFGGGTMSDELVRRVNREIVRHAYEAVYRHPATDWPSHIRLSPARPELPSPQITLQEAREGVSPTFPFTYPTPVDSQIDRLLELLGAESIVE